MPEVLDWQGADQRQVVQRAVRALGEGRLVAFPTETSYHLVASALHPNAVAELGRHAGPAADGPLLLAVSGSAAALDWAPAMSPLARRLARRCWPGPVAFDVSDGVGDGLAGQLPGPVRERLCGAGTLRLCAPAHEALLHALHLFPGPLVTAAARADGEAATTAEAVTRQAGAEVALVIDDGPSHYASPPTVVRVEGARYEVVRPGVVDEATLAELSPTTVVFLCTGNTCRSPLAEALCKKLLAERLGCTPAELPARGYRVLSAGLSAMSGDAAAAEAVEVARELGADLSNHRSQRLTHDLLAQADHLIAMTRAHLRAVAPYCTADGPRPQLLSATGRDVPDPIGCAQEVYRECAQEIARCLEELIPSLVLSP